MMKEITDEKLHGKLQLMYRNAQRLLNLVNQLLDFRKNEMAGLHPIIAVGSFMRSLMPPNLMAIICFSRPLWTDRGKSVPSPGLM